MRHAGFPARRKPAPSPSFKKIADAKRMMYEIARDFERRAAQAERQLADNDMGKSH
jgi:hypothetical protein